MSNMKCPVCKGELYIFKSSTQDAIVCADCGFDGNTKLWQELIRTHKALEVAVDALKDCEKILKADRKDWEYLTADIALKQIEQITALEQKE